VNYLRTRYDYNNQGQVDRVQNPAGTITISTFDGLSRITGKRKERKRAGMIL
jgi:YD repeat-containing protein